ncbi:MAG TPA: ribonuclease III [Geobacteraceae bacterium]|nr:ribonuclease III [Geobacteraceae bacterium]
MLINQETAYSGLENAVGYRFRNLSLLQEALTHRSRANEVSGKLPDNQRLEFFGDSILGFLIGRELFLCHPDWNEGELSRHRSALVDEENLARLAQAVDLGSFLVLGKGEEKSGGRGKKSLLADAYEALIAAVYLDGGMQQVQRLVKRQFGHLLAGSKPADLTRDYKTELQELTQSRLGTVPRYELLDSTGPDHDRSYRVAVYVNDAVAGDGSGRSKKAAQQAAARAALEKLG